MPFRQKKEFRGEDAASGLRSPFLYIKKKRKSEQKSSACVLLAKRAIKRKRSYKKTHLCRKTRVRFFVVPLTGLEPVRYLYRGILSPLRLPVPPQRHIGKANIVANDGTIVKRYFYKFKTILALFLSVCRESEFWGLTSEYQLFIIKTESA